TSPWLAPPAAFGFAIGIGIMMPALQSLATRTVDDRSRGGVLGLYQSSVSLSTIVSTGVSGLFYSVSPVLPYWIGGVVSLAVALPALALLRWFAKHTG
ncbi:MAG: MFS transporter, partial [Gammaproteobacteria bacterium]